MSYAYNQFLKCMMKDIAFNLDLDNIKNLPLHVIIKHILRCIDYTDQMTPLTRIIMDQHPLK